MDIMGASEVYVIEKGWSMREAFAKAREEAADEYGHQEGASGAINSCQLGRTYAKDAYTDDELRDMVNKREAIGYCKKLPIPEKEEGVYVFIGLAPD